MVYNDYMAAEEVTTIQIKKSTRDKLLEAGRKDETYDDLLLRLIECLGKKGSK